jgi:hypothetical protein
MRHPKIPEGFRYWTSEPDFDDAWDLAVQYKEMRERIQPDMFVRTRVIQAARTYWVLVREEERAR